MRTFRGTCLCFAALGLLLGPAVTADAQTIEIPFTSHDGHAMLGKLTLPPSPGPHPVVLIVQTAEAATADTRVQGPKGPIDAADIYRRGFASVGAGVFTYEGRGVRLGTSPPRYSTIDWPAFNTSTLDNKVRDAITALRVVQKQTGVDASRIFLRGHSEGSLLAAEAASRVPAEIRGVVLSGVVTEMRAALKFMASDGLFWQHQGHWDANRDGTITTEEFTADPRGIRKLMPATITFSTFDRNGDGSYTIQDVYIGSKSIMDGTDARNVEAVMPYLKATAAMEIPEGWLADHFAHAPIDAFLSKLTMPVGVFHGEMDQLTPVTEARALEQRMKAAGRTNVEFRYFPGFDHSLGGMQYFLRGTPSDPYRAMFEYVKTQLSTSSDRRAAPPSPAQSGK